MYAILFPSLLPLFLPNGAWCMPQGPFPDPDPDPGPDDRETAGSPPPPPADPAPGTRNASPPPPAAKDEEDGGPGPEQGLYVCLPAEHLTLSGFAQGGAADTMAPGALLGTAVEAVNGEDGAGLPGC